MFGNRKLGTSLAILAVAGMGVFAVGCGGSSDDVQSAIDDANQQAEEIQNNVNQQIDEANQQAQDLQDQAQQQVEDAQNQVDGSEAQQQVDDAQKQLDDIQQQVEDAMKAGSSPVMFTPECCGQ